MFFVRLELWAGALVRGRWIRVVELKLLSAVCDRKASGAVVSYDTLWPFRDDYRVVSSSCLTPVSCAQPFVRFVRLSVVSLKHQAVSLAQ